ncbi:MAG TPA: hypothetical protein PKG71_03580 [Candidatus Woesebacteria bacterium]|nr:hypothetical protein [Candidatus Woesebacteria bacterium]HNS95023.1 hypothetical protein [Candidatus Woesebacteria bacterium]
MQIRKITINVLFVLSLFQVIGLVWYILFEDSLILSFMFQSPPLSLLFLIGPMLGFILGYSDTDLFGPIDATIALFSPIIPFLFLSILFVRNNSALEQKKLLKPIVIIFGVLFLSSSAHLLFQKTQSFIIQSGRAQYIARQTDLFDKGIVVEYLGALGFTDRSFHDNGKEYHIYQFSVSFSNFPIQEIEAGTYTLCLSKLFSTSGAEKPNTCLIRTKLDINPENNTLTLGDELESDYPFWYSLVEPGVKIHDNSLVLAVTGISSSLQQEAANLIVFGSDRTIGSSGFIHGGETVYNKAIVGPVEPFAMP